VNAQAQECYLAFALLKGLAARSCAQLAKHAELFYEQVCTASACLAE
jgi:hypothetical protein